MRNRQKDEMLRDILSCTNGGARISEIMFRAFACHSQVKQYLAVLIDNGHVECDGIDRKYRATTKGMEYLDGIQRLSEILKIETKRYAKIPNY